MLLHSGRTILNDVLRGGDVLTLPFHAPKVLTVLFLEKRKTLSSFSSCSRVSWRALSLVEVEEDRGV